MNRRMVLFLALILTAGFCFGQTSALRDYVGMINQTFHPDIVSFLQKLRTEVEKRGNNAAARSIDNYLKGNSGTGFVYVAGDGNNYIITNHHVISQAHTLTITFEKQDGEKIKFADLSIIAADEEIDIALLAFAGGQNPFKAGLSFLKRQIEEGDDVFSAGFPGLGTSMIWQLGRGMVSNTSVRFPEQEDSEKMLGPFIQHTAQIDPGNSGGPLLIQTAGVPTGYAVAGINTLKARYRQAANFSIPMNRVQSFLDASLKKDAVDERALLDARIASFVEGLGVNKAVYPHIADYLSNTCTGENAEYAISEILEKAPRTTVNDIITAFDYSPVEGMSYAVAWTIENALRSKAGKIAVSTESVTQNGANGFTVTFVSNENSISSEWVNEYGIWRIKRFGDFASGDKTLIEKKAKEKKTSDRLRSDPSFQVAAGMAYIVDRGPAFALNLVGRSSLVGYGLQGFIRGDFFQIDALTGLYVPIKAGSVAFTPYVNLGAGLQVKEKLYAADNFGFKKDLSIGLVLGAGMQFTTAAVPGLYLQAGYQFNLFFLESTVKSDPHAIFIGLGYGF